jgi:hypothetical protein
VLVRVRARARRVRIGVADHVKKILGHRMWCLEGPNTRAPVPLRVRAERTSCAVPPDGPDIEGLTWGSSKDEDQQP